MEQFITRDILEGIRYVHVPTDRFKTARFTIRFALPLGEKTVNAFAAVPGLLRYTSARYPTNMQLERKLAALYGAGVSASEGSLADAQILSFTISVIDDRFALEGESISEEALAFLLEMIFEPDLDANGWMKEANLQREKRLSIEEIKAEQNDKMTHSLNRFQKHFYAGEPASVRISIEGMEKLTVQDVTNAWKEMLTAAQVFVCSVGNFDAERAASSIKAAFEKVNRNYHPLKIAPHKAREEVKTIVETEPLEQCKLNIGYTFESDDFAAGKVFLSVFGGNEMSLLSKVVREKMSLCYYCSASLGILKKVMIVYSGVEADNRQKATQAIEEQLACMKNGEFDEQQLAVAKRKLKELYMSFDTPADIARWYLSRMLYEEILTPQQAFEELEVVTPQRIIAFAQGVKADTVYSLGEK